MLKVHTLYSSSSGNMFHIENKDTNILLDVGVTYKAINEGLNSINKDLSNIDAIVITHEHVDHIKGLYTLCKKNDIPIYTTEKTAIYLKDKLNEKNIDCDIQIIDYNKPFNINSIELRAFETSHDAVMPCGYNIKSENSKLSFATDLGYMTDYVYENLKDSNFVILESNYDDILLDYGKYPFNLKRRIKGSFGHLSNTDAAETISKLANNGQTNFLLAHLSQNNNNEYIAKDTILTNLTKNDIDINNINLNIATKTLSNEEYII